MELAERRAWLDERLAALHLDPLPDLPEIGCAVLAADGSDEMVEPAGWAELAEEVHLVFSQRRSPRGAGASPKVTEALAEDARLAFSSAQEALGGQVQEHVHDASPARGIMSTAQAVEADLVCLGPRLVGFGDTPGLGSVAETLVHHAPFPVLLARHAPTDGPIVVGLGEEPSTRDAAAWALALADRLGCPLVAVHSAPDDLEALDLDTFEASKGDDEARLIGWPPETHLLEAIEDLAPCLTVVGHGRNREWLGSNALHLLRQSTGASLVVPWGGDGPEDPS